MDTKSDTVRQVRVEDPAVATSVSTADTTVVNVEPQRPLPPDGRPPGPPWPLIAMVAGVVLIGLLGWWWVTSQRQADVTAAATATAVAQATATAESALASQRSAEAAQAAVQATSVAQATAVTNAQVAAQRVAADATAAAARVAPTVPPPPPATPVVVVVTATPAPAPPPPPPPPAAAPPPPPTVAPEAVAPQSPLAAIPQPPVRQPAAPTFAPGAAKPVGAPPLSAAPSPAASPAVAGPAPTPTSVTTTPGQPLLLRCLGDRVQLSAAPDTIPAQTTVSCRPVDAGSIAPPPGPVVDEALFEIDVEVRNGRELTSPLDIQVTYAANAVPPAERGTLKLGYFDGKNWSAVREQTADQAARRISAKVSEGGTFGLYRQP